jgi:phospholipase/carboxylesterase
MSAELLPCVEIVTGGKPAGAGAGAARGRPPRDGSGVSRAVIWMHGLGADGHDFEPIVPYLGLDDLRVRFVFPHAPKRAVTINMGLLMPAWYDIREASLRRDHDEAGIRDSAERIGALIARERERGVPGRGIVLAGFSQGGAMALYVGLRHPEPLAGILALSCYLLGDDALEMERSAANRDVPIFQAHGTMDPMVAQQRAEHGRDALRRLGYTVDWHTYPMGHEIHPQEIQEVGAWLKARLQNVASEDGGTGRGR